MMDDILCRATRADGQPCKGKALDDGYCFAHSPALAAQRQAGNEEGGRNKATAERVQRLLPRDLKPVLGLLIRAMQEVHDGAITPSQASAMAACAGAISRLYGSVELAQTVADLEARVHDHVG